MKKFLSTLTVGVLFVTAANADFIRVEMGGGVWNQTPSGYVERTDSDGALKLNGRYDSAEEASSEVYVWAFFKHPVPIVPNLRLEYVTLSDKGTTTGSVNGFDLQGNGAPTTIDTAQYDVIPYYNLLDNTFWTTIDVGIDLKIIESDVNVGKVTASVVGIGSATIFDGYSSTDTTLIPLLYLRGRVQIPFTGVGVEADSKVISDGTNTFYDVRAKVDYTLNFIPVVQPGLEVGYRMQKIRVDDGDTTQVDLDYSGVYAGLMLRF